MSMMGLKKMLDFRKMTPPKAVTLVFVASVLLIVISYGVWQLGRLLSPSGIFNSGSPFVELKVSDYYDNNGVYTPLPNNRTDTETPVFDVDGVKLPLTFDAGGTLNMARLEIQLDYR